MKVRNLYIGDIRILADIEMHEDKNSYISKLQRKTVFEKKKDDSLKVKDIVYGGTYPIKKSCDCCIGESFATNLEQYELLKLLEQARYDKQNISKAMLLKILEDNKKVGGNYEKSI